MDVNEVIILREQARKEMLPLFAKLKAAEKHYKRIKALYDHYHSLFQQYDRMIAEKNIRVITPTQRKEKQVINFTKDQAARIIERLKEKGYLIE